MHVYRRENPDINEITGKTLISFNRAGVLLKEVSYLCKEIFVFSDQDTKDSTELERDATELEVFPAFYFKAVATFLFQTTESIITTETKRKLFLFRQYFAVLLRENPVLSHHLLLVEESRVF